MFRYDNKFWRFMAKSVDVLLVSILGFIGCIPILTIGRSLYAMTQTFREMKSGKQISITKAFASHFTVKKWLVWPTVSFILMLTNLFAALFILFSEQLNSNVVFFIAFMMYLYLLITNIYLFPLLTYGDFQPVVWVKFIVYIAIKHLPYTVLLALINGVVLLILTYVIPYLFPIFLGVDLWINVKITTYLISLNDYEKLFNPPI